MVDSAGLLAQLDETTLEQIPAQYRPASGNWLGFAARSTAVVYNKSMLTPEDMPASILDFANPEWKGKISFSPTGADFQAIVSAVLQLKGEDVTRSWLEGLKANGTVLKNNLVVLQAVNDGQVAAGIEYHYYWNRDRAESGDNSDNSALHFFGKQDPGAFVSISGAGILESSEKQADAQKFIDFLVSEKGQQDLGDSYALEYPLRPGASLPTHGEAVLRPRAAHCRLRNPQRPAGHRDDAGSRVPLTLTDVRPPRRTDTKAPASPFLVLAGVRRRAARAGAAVLRRVLHAHHQPW